MINVIGLGYIGLPTALMFANSGVKVVGTDINDSLINSLNNKKLNFSEEGLEELFQKANNNIEFTTNYVEAETYIIAVPTPFKKDKNKLESKYLKSAINSVLDVCLKNSIIIIESTVSPGTIDNEIRKLVMKRGFNLGEDVHLVHAPERIIPGNMIYELRNNSRTIGADSFEIGSKVKELYSLYCEAEILVTDINITEMSKVVENTYRDINIAFANELAKICRLDNIDVYEVIRIANKHPRVNILQPGPGVGGHCISVDPWFLVGGYPDLTRLTLTARKINDSMPSHVLKRIRDIMKENNIKDINKVGLYGLTYKENVNDTRESPTLQLLKKMEDHLAFGVKVYDPLVKKQLVDKQYMNFEKFLNEIEILVIMVAHNHIKENINTIESKFILDTKNIKVFEGHYTI